MMGHRVVHRERAEDRSRLASLSMSGRPRLTMRHRPMPAIGSLFRRTLFAVAAAFLLGCAHTEPFVDADGERVPNSIASMERWTVRGTSQSVWLRGFSLDNPVLILLHGGPGTSEASLFRRFVPELEHSYVMVYWEQPGAGRSFTSQSSREEISIERFLADLDVVVDESRRRFGKDKVLLLRHSWGSALGMLYAHRHPEKVAAYVGIGQVANMQAGERMSYAFALNQAIAVRNEAAIEELRRIGDPPHSVDQMLMSRKWVERFGGTFHNGLSTGKLILAALPVAEVDFTDLYRFGMGNRLSLKRLWPEFSRLDLEAAVQSVDVPVFFLLGRYDNVTPSALAAAYLDRLSAACKRAIWFESSAHNAPFEEPKRFVSVLSGTVKEAALAGRCPREK
jgi:proline iminopeptidase